MGVVTVKFRRVANKLLSLLTADVGKLNDSSMAFS